LNQDIDNKFNPDLVLQIPDSYVEHLEIKIKELTNKMSLFEKESSLNANLIDKLEKLIKNLETL
jgi:hypothetical protein